METKYLSSFSKDLKKIKSQEILALTEKNIDDIKNAEDIRQIKNLKKLKGHSGLPYTNKGF